jgi:hypothetical protein
MYRLNLTDGGNWTSVDRLIWLNSTIEQLQKNNNNFDAVAISWNPNSNFTLTDKDGKVWPMELTTQSWGIKNESILN